MSKGLEAITSPVSTELRNGKQYYTYTKEDIDIAEKGLKALEIIKNKNVFVWGFIHRREETKDFEQTYEYYKTHYGYFHSGYDISNNLLTQEEYDLLKEALKDD